MPIIEIDEHVPVSEKNDIYEIVTKKYHLPDKIIVKDKNGEPILFCYDSRMREYRSVNRDKTIDALKYLKSIISKTKNQEDNEDVNSL